MASTEAPETIDIGPHGVALQAGQAVGVCAQALNRAGPGFPLLHRVGVEALDDPPGLVDGSPEALPVLLHEFRPLRGDDPAEKAEGET